MSDLNKAMIIGRLGQDPDIKYLPSGAAVVNISVATGEKWKDKETGDKNERTEWHRVTAYGRLAEIIGAHLTKGSQVYIEGRLQTRKWQAQDGTDRYSTEIVASQMQMLGGKGDGRQRPAAQGRAQPKPLENDSEEGFDSEIPF